MKNIIIRLPLTLQSSGGKQPPIDFEFTKHCYTINGETTKRNFDVLDGAIYWDYSILNKSIIVTLYTKNDIIN